MANINQTPWKTGSVFICTKCGAKSNQPNLADEVKTEVRKKQKAEETNGEIRVITSACLGVCYPEKQTFAFMPVDGKTEVYTTEINKEVLLNEINELLARKISK
ncbi:(2Fe-2S) ferredoxin domain-containing protein [bacterium]|nr:(2Fe-2S) ferredoxin domain-containing protein [bacterium]